MTTKRLTYHLLLLMALPLCLLSCREEAQITTPIEEESANLTISLGIPQIALTRGVSDDPRNEKNTWSDAEKLTDGRYLYHVTLLLVEETTGRLVAIRDIGENFTEHISDETSNYGANGFIKNGQVNTQGTSGDSVVFTFNYDHPRHGTCEKLRRGIYKMIVLANYAARSSGYAGLTDDNNLQMQTWIDQIKSEFDVNLGKGIDNFMTAYSDFFDFTIEAESDLLCSKSNPQPLSLVKDIALHPGDNHISEELIRTYSRIRIELLNNSSSCDLKINSLNFSNIFAQRKTYLFDDPDNPNRKYNDFTKGAPNTQGSNAITSFSSTTLAKQNSKVVFDGYILESRDNNNAGYYYTLDVEYKGNKLLYSINTTSSSLTEIKSNAVSNISNANYFIIQNSNSGKNLYDKSGTLYQGDKTLDDLADETDDDYLWALITRNNGGYYIYNKGSGQYISYSNSGTTSLSTTTNGYYVLTEDYGQIILESHKNNNTTTYLNNWGGSGTNIGGWTNRDNGSYFYFFLVTPSGTKDAKYNTPILLETIDPITAQVTAVKSIQRNDFINVLVTVSFDEMNGDFKFKVVPWTNAKDAEIEFN